MLPTQVGAITINKMGFSNFRKIKIKFKWG